MHAEVNIETAIRIAREGKAVELTGKGVAVVSLAELERLISAAENAEDVVAFDDYVRRQHAGETETITHQQMKDELGL